MCVRERDLPSATALRGDMPYSARIPCSNVHNLSEPSTGPPAGFEPKGREGRFVMVDNITTDNNSLRYLQLQTLRRQARS